MTETAADGWFQAIAASDLIALHGMIETHAKTVDASGHSGLMLAAKHGNIDIVDLLAPHEAGMVNPDGYTATMIAVMRDHLPIFAYLAPMEKDILGPNQQDVLMIAVSSESKDVVEYLSGKHSLRRDAEGHTAFDLALAIGNGEILRILLATNVLDNAERARLISVAQDNNRKDLAALLTEVRCTKASASQSPSPRANLCVRTPGSSTRASIDRASAEAAPVSAANPFFGSSGQTGSRRESADGSDRYSTTVGPEVSLNVISTSTSPARDVRARTPNNATKQHVDCDLEIERLCTLFESSDARAALLTHSSMRTEVQLLSHIFHTLQERQIDLTTQDARLLYYSMRNFSQKYTSLISPCDTRIFTTSSSPCQDYMGKSLDDELKRYQLTNAELSEQLDNAAYNLKCAQKVVTDIRDILTFYYKNDNIAFQPDNVVASLQSILATKTEQIAKLQAQCSQQAIEPNATSSTTMHKIRYQAAEPKRSSSTTNFPPRTKYDESAISSIAELAASVPTQDLTTLHQLLESKDRHINELTAKIAGLENNLVELQNRFVQHTNFTKAVEKNLADTINSQINLFMSGQHNSQKVIDEENQKINQLYVDLEASRSVHASRTSSPMRSHSTTFGAMSQIDGQMPYPDQPMQIPPAIFPPKNIHMFESDPDEPPSPGYVPKAEYDALLNEYNLAQRRFEKHIEFAGSVETGLAQSLSDQIQVFAAESRNSAERLRAKDEEMSRLIAEMAAMRARLDMAGQQSGGSQTNLDAVNEYNAMAANIEASQTIQQLRTELRELRSRILEKDDTIVTLQHTIRTQRFHRNGSPMRGAANTVESAELERLQQELKSYKEHAEKTQQNDQALIQVLQARIKQQNDILEVARSTSPAPGQHRQTRQDSSEESQLASSVCPNCAEMTSQRQRYVHKVDQLEAENRELAAELDKSRGMVVSLRNEKDGLLNELSSVLQNMEEHHKKDKLITDLNNECTSLTNRVDILMAELTKYSDLEHEIAVLRKENSDFKAVNDELQNENMKLSTLLAKKVAVCDGEVMTELTYHSISNAFEDIEILRQHIASLKHKIHALENDADNVKVVSEPSPSPRRAQNQSLYSSPSVISPYHERKREEPSAQLDTLQKQMQELQTAVLVLAKEHAQNNSSNSSNSNPFCPERRSSTLNYPNRQTASPRQSSASTRQNAPVPTPAPEQVSGFHVYAEHTPLMNAVLAGDAAGVKKNLRYAQGQLKDGTTALMLAAHKENKEIVELLLPLEGGMRRKDGKTALYQSLKRENFKLAQILTPLEGPDVSRYSKEGGRRTELMNAIIADDYVLAWALLRVQAGLQDKDGKTALMYAAYKGSTCFVNMLKKKEYGARSKNGMTALMYAARSNKPEVVRLLMPLEAGLQDKNGISIGQQCSALMHACYNGSLDAALCLLAQEAPLRDSQNRTAMHYAMHCSSIVTPEKKASIVQAITGTVPAH